MTKTSTHIELTETYAAHNYHPLPVVIASGEGAWVTDVDGKRYLDCLAGYSALNFGHSHPRLVAVATEQLGALLVAQVVVGPGLHAVALELDDQLFVDGEAG